MLTLYIRFAGLKLGKIFYRHAIKLNYICMSSLDNLLKSYYEINYI